MRIYRVSAQDERVHALDASLFGAEYAPEWRGQWWLVREGANSLAYAGATFWGPDRYVFLSRCGVMPEARGQGLQRRLIRVRENWARELSAIGCYTYTAPGNIHSANNLIACGYQLWSPARKWGVPGALYWSKEFRK